eukprot:TRINITY_DN110485_c0_g1_i1.p1 TRINITY_DN110485_c0_g1~~TRINITY_DN110485_c0_g1_i1.p1  ORF type:complete len:193 (-),score=42.37 TRINITY_DN110485_c0_g1_i1:155-676(-)
MAIVMKPKSHQRVARILLITIIAQAASCILGTSAAWMYGFRGNAACQKGLACERARPLGLTRYVTVRTPLRRAAVDGEAGITKVEICTHRDCKRRGGGEKLKKIFEELAAGTDIEVDEFDCFDECPYGPNVRALHGPDDEFGKVLNGVKGREHVAEILGVKLSKRDDVNSTEK